MAQILKRIYQCDQCFKVDALKLDCQHQKCLDCLKMFIKEKSTERNIDNFYCPSCFQEIPSELSEIFLCKKEDFQGYLKELKRCEYCKNIQNYLIFYENRKLMCLNCLERAGNSSSQPKVNHPNQSKPPQVPNPIPIIPSKPKQKVPCFSCKSNPGITESCIHNYCLPCLNTLSKSSISKDPFSPVKCEKCNFPIPQSEVILSFTSELNFTKYQETCVNNLFFAVKFDCGVCMNNFRIEEGITFDCDHRFCLNCVKEYFREKIMSSNVSEDELVCPSCGVAIDHNIIQGIDRELYDKYVNFAFRNWRPQDGAILKYCCFCDAAAEIAENAKRFKCPKCQKAYCPQCNKDHLERISCEDFVNMEERQKEENEKVENNRRMEERKKKEIENEKFFEEQKKAVPKANDKKDKGQDQHLNLINDDHLRKEEEKKKQEEEKRRKKEIQKQKADEKKRIEEEKRQKEEKKQKDLQKIEKNKNDNYLNAIKNESKKCPKCKNFVLKDSGCNFIKCRWPGCKDSFFCYLCSNPLKSTQHYSHYKSSGPFGRTCNKLDNIKD